jgi:MFS family permease
MSTDFWKFWTGQTISNLGSSFTQWAVPILVYNLTHSAVSLGVATAATFLPYLLFGLLIGAWMDRVDRKRAMIALDWLNAAVIFSIPLVATYGHLTVWWIYGVTFIQSTVFIAFSAGEFAAVPSLVESDDLVTANGRIQATYSAAQVAGPLLAGLLVSFIAVQWVMALDAASFAVSAVTLSLIGKSFNAADDGEPKEATTIFRDVAEGLRYVLGHPVLRNISLMMALINFVGASTYAQLVLFARERLDASTREIGILFAAGSAGVVVTGLFAGRLRKRFSFTALAMSSLMLMGAIEIGFCGDALVLGCLTAVGSRAGSRHPLQHQHRQPAAGDRAEPPALSHPLDRRRAGVVRDPCRRTRRRVADQGDGQRRTRLRHHRRNGDRDRGRLPFLDGPRRRGTLRRGTQGAGGARRHRGRHRLTDQVTVCYKARFEFTARHQVTVCCKVSVRAHNCRQVTPCN